MSATDLEAASGVTLQDGTVLSRCDQCREMWRERNERGIEGEPPCEGCRVELLPENEEAASVYMSTRRQYVTAENGRVVDISIPAVKTMMDLLGVRDQRMCLMRVVKTFHFFMGKHGND